MLSKETKYGLYGEQEVIVVPRDISKDSAFPYKANERVTITIDGERLIIERIREGETKKRGKKENAKKK